MITNLPHKYCLGTDLFGKKTNIITTEHVKQWCEQGSDQQTTLPTWVKCRDDLQMDGRWYRVPDQSVSVQNLNIASDTSETRFKPIVNFSIIVWYLITM